MAESDRGVHSRLRPLAAACVAVVVGFGVWAGVGLATGSMRDGVFVAREAWDTDVYLMVGLPAMAAAAAAAGFLAPARVWRWPLWTAAGHGVSMALVHPPGAGLGLLPLALVLVGLPMVVLLTIPAVAGAILARRGWDRAIIAGSG